MNIGLPDSKKQIINTSAKNGLKKINSKKEIIKS
tara:strand:- start:768 stop:869 length:102 start_codon:yes stop_codon:yes gene_type:complete